MTSNKQTAQDLNKLGRNYSLDEIARAVGGKLYGPADRLVAGIQPLDTAGPKDISFLAPRVRRQSREILSSAVHSKAAAIFVREFLQDIPSAQIVVADPLQAVIRISSWFHKAPLPKAGIDPRAVVDESAKIGENVSIGPFCIVGRDAVIGDRTVLHSHVVVYDGASIGTDCIIHVGAIVR